MSDSFFDFDEANRAAADQTFEEDDDTEYDALNSETFGENAPSSDWEEVHEKLASELEKRSFDDENNELSERIASYILDDEGDDCQAASNNIPVQITPAPQASAAPGHSKWWTNGIPHAPMQQPETWWEHQPNSFTPTEKKLPMLPKPTKILTVNELEEKMRQEALSAAALRPLGPGPGPGPVNRPENMMPGNHMHNGNYARRRGARNQFHQDGHEQSYHAVHHPFPPYHPPLIRQTPRQQGPMAPRQFHDGRYMVHPTGAAARVPRPMHGGSGDHHFHKYAFLPNQQMPYQQTGHPPPYDEYAGLMRPQEKQWLATIQMMQLNTNQPYKDDYYCMMHQQRQQGSSGRKMAGAHGHKNNREAAPPKPTYTPLQFENSLGKLQIGSVTAPRKIIDMDLVENFDQQSKLVDKKSKQILIEIEEIYNYVLQMEDAFNPLNSSSTKQEIDLVAVQEKLLNILLAEGKLVQVMSIKKGKKAVLRMMPLLFNPSLLVHKLLVDLVSITRKDSEQLLLSFLPAIRIYLSTASLKTLVELTNNYDNHFLLSNKFTVSVMANMIERADQVRCDCKEEAVLNDWDLFLIRLVESIRYWSETERPVVAVDRNILTTHLAHITDQVRQEDLTAFLRTLQSAVSAPAHPPTPAPDLPKN